MAAELKQPGINAGLFAIEENNR